MASVLIIDDDKAICSTLCAAIQRMGHEALQALTLTEGLRIAASRKPDIVFLDVKMPDGSGLDILPIINALSDPPEVIVMTALGAPEGVEIAIKSGAWAYMEKPSSIQEIMEPLARALEYRHEKKCRVKFVPNLDREQIIGSSPQMSACLEVVGHAAMSGANVIITGETGTGKELVARAIHNNSPRSQGPFVVLDCSALAENLVESMLFGHEKGAFTGAVKPNEGVIKQAHGGTLFLDEIGELPLSIQKSFLSLFRRASFACFRRDDFDLWGPDRNKPAISGSLPPRTGTSTRWSPMAGFGRICSFVSAPSP